MKKIARNSKMTGSRYIHNAVMEKLKVDKEIFFNQNQTDTVMKLNLEMFDAENMVYQRKGDACISLSRNAASSISKAAALRMGLDATDKIAIGRDIDNPDDWYLVSSQTGFSLRDDKGDGTLFFNNASLANKILDAIGVEEDRAAFYIANEYTESEDEPGVQHWLLFTSKPIIKSRKKKK